MNSFPALTGDVVTQGHVNYCLANGHATHSVDGVTANYCPRCGEVTARQFHVGQSLTYRNETVSFRRYLGGVPGYAEVFTSRGSRTVPVSTLAP